MTAIPKAAGMITPEEYLEGEPAAEVRHEYVDGYVYAMAGATQNHNRIAGRIFSILDAKLSDQGCEPFMHDMKVKIPPTFAEAFYYPDVMVVCDPTDNHDLYRERPVILIEVISPDSESTDRREKAIAYRQIPTIRAYVLVEQDRMAVTILHRVESGWRSEVLEGPEAVLKFPVINVEIPLSRIYQRTGIAKSGKSE